MKYLRPILASFIIIAILTSSLTVAVAAPASPLTSDFWKWLGEKVDDGSSGSVGMVDYVKSIFSSKDSGCTKGTTGFHYWQLVSDLPVSTITNKFRVKCANCGMYYADYSSCDPEKEAEAAYSDYVSTLPATGYDSAGKLLWQPKWMDDTKKWGLSISSSNGSIASYPTVGVTSNDYISAAVVGSFITFSPLKSTLISVGSYSVAGGSVGGIWYYHSFSAPIAGTYTRLASDAVVGSYLSSKGSFQLSRKWSAKSLGGKAKGEGLDADSFDTVSLSGVKAGSFYLYTPVYQIVPFEPATITNNYTINTRVNNFNGDYYDSVTNNYYNNTTIVDETTNNYYDMTTNNYYTMSNWSYDYASRTYFITLEDGTTVTVQFGDDCLTITNNNVENSYQYVINSGSGGSGSGGGDTPETPTTCKHNWTETIDTEPTCLEGGHASYTCSLCGETYEQLLAAKGHTWTVTDHVNTVYGESGEIITQGHTLYECSTCGEQWYTDTGAPPPDVSGGSSVRAWLQAFQLWLGDKLDSLFSAADAPIISRLDAILSQLQSTSGSASCEHTYQQHMEQEAACTLPGLQVFTCSQCGDSYSEIIDPLGHDWQCTDHVAAITDPETGEETAAAYDVYTCSRCGDTYNDYSGDGAPEDYSSSTISQLIVRMFSKLGTFAGKLIGFVVHLFDKAITSLDNVITKFNDYVTQISGFGGDYPAWLTGFWAVIPAELQAALTFAVICMALGVVGKKLFFS